MPNDPFSKNESITYPIRLNRYLYLTGVSSRRQADRFIEQGQILVNGEPAILGQKINKNDQVELKKKAKQFTRNYVYYIFNKPVNVVSHNPQSGEKSVEDIFKPKDGPVFPVGRLDKASYGLMFLTNDGRIIDKMLNPKFNHEKEYIVTVDKPINNLLIKHLNLGVNIEGYQTKPTDTKQIDNRTLRIILTEGKKHQIRRMCATLGYQVADLKRIRILNLKLKDLKEGQGRKLNTAELEKLFATIKYDE